ncbi:pectinesterase-like [Zingiber officinale]|uniref:Pectinesterase n=1 Tax=Zingiber officinale TaxID=94328 RepID=A0A8J5FY77_ZINOF|nr:pectinesterase-like [Zingiber officinale]KAG6497100.1 hypothetical protein ZIOFF_044988 [Zingiber officinale]
MELLICLLFFLSLVAGRPSHTTWRLFSARDELQRLTSLVGDAQNSVPDDDRHLSTASGECLGLFRLAEDALRWSVSDGDPKTTPSTGDHLSDLHSWLTAAAGYLIDCKDGLNLAGVHGGGIARRLHRTSSLVTSALREVASLSAARGRRLVQGFPDWVPADHLRLIMGDDLIIKADVVVAQDNTGNYTTLGDALAAAPEKADRYVIYVKKGVYKEYVEVRKPNLTIMGEGMNETIFSGDRNNATGNGTGASATFTVSGPRFITINLAIENTAGPKAGPAVALRSDSDLSVYYRCRISGYQDTLFASSNRQFYRECRIFGTVDYIFGNAAAVFQRCDILSRLPPHGNADTITAQSRELKDQNSGYSFQFCNVSADEDLPAAGVDTFLGRPWRNYSRVVFMQSYLDSSIPPAGWLDWDGRGSTADYGEFENYGPGSSLAGRVNWTGYHILNKPAEAAPFTAHELINGDSWLPSAGVPYTLDLNVTNS